MRERPFFEIHSMPVWELEGKSKTYHLDRNYNVQLTVTIPANGYTWYVIE